MRVNKQVTEVIGLLKSGKIGVMPTDTIYGLVGSALNPTVVEKIYKLRKRAKDKPFIILISDLNDLNHFNVKLTKEQKDFLQRFWPNPLSVVLPVDSKEFAYLHRGKYSLAFRMPKDEKLLWLLKLTGPLVAPSANIEGGKPAETIEKARSYFGDQVNLYMGRGKMTGLSSTLIQLERDSSYKVLRKGSFRL